VFRAQSNAKFCSVACRQRAWRKSQANSANTKAFSPQQDRTSTMTNIAPRPQDSNTSFPFRPGYSPPNFADQQPEPSRVQRAAGRFNGTPAAVAFAAVQHADQALGEHVSSIDPRLPADLVTEQVAAFRDSPAYKAVAQTAQAVNDASDAADAKVAHVWASLSPDGDAAQESRNTRYWNGKAGVLDSITDPSKLMTAVGDLIKTASATELGVLLDQVPDYAASRGMQSTDWLDPVVAAAVPEYGDAKADQQIANKARDITNANAQTFNKVMTNTTTHPGGAQKVFYVDPAAAASTATGVMSRR
jgi:hypothetical protein